MAIKLDDLLIIDVEATCWEKGQQPKGQYSEIIEVGICLFNLDDWRPTEKYQLVIRPAMSEVSKYCTNLTGWTEALLDEYGGPFADATRALQNEFLSGRRVWASWGDYDRLIFEKDCKRKGLNYPFSVKHINLKTLFAIHNKLKKEVGMTDALRIAGLSLEGRHHIGADDAWNIGRILEWQGRF